jgi:hypothetical protein
MWDMLQQNMALHQHCSENLLKVRNNNSMNFDRAVRYRQGNYSGCAVKAADIVCVTHNVLSIRETCL